MTTPTRSGHPHNALSAAFVRTVKDPGRYTDGNGLQLVVDGPAHKYWVLRTVIRGQRTDLGLGSARLVPLAEAREEAARLRKIARQGGDPREVRRRERVVVPTFAEAARIVHGEHAVGWKNPKHAKQWISTLERYAFPTIGGHRIDTIGAPEVLSVLAPIWLVKPETARRVRQRMGVVFEWAKVKHGTGANPVESVSSGLPKQNDDVKHFAALPFSEIPDFMPKLRAEEGVASLALELAILSAMRTEAIIPARPAEFDLDAAVWSVPAARMKGKKRVDHKVPLSPRAVAIARSRIEAGGEFLFPGNKEGSHLSNGAMLALLERMGRGDITVHGFRSTFKDWAAESTAFPDIVSEMALGHTIPNKVEKAYRRGDLLAKRRLLMAAWAEYCETKRGDVVPIRAQQSSAASPG